MWPHVCLACTAVIKGLTSVPTMKIRKPYEKAQVSHQHGAHLGPTRVAAVRQEAGAGHLQAGGARLPSSLGGPTPVSV